MKSLLFILLSIPAFAGQGIVLGSGQSVNFTTPGTGIWSALSSWQVDFRVRDFAPASGAGRVLWGGDNHNCSLNTGTLVMRCRTNIGSSGYVDTDLTGRDDVRVRLRRDYTNLLFTVEVWDGDGANYTFGSNVISSSPSTFSDAKATAVGSYDGSQLYCLCTIDFFRWGTTLSAVGATAPQDIASVESLMTFEFEGNLTNASATLTGTLSTGVAAYDTSPTYPPVLSIGGTRTVRSGSVVAFTSAASFSPNGNGSFASWFWTCIGVTATSTCRFSDRSSATPNITFPTTGTYTVRLTAVDGTGESSVLDTTIGAVATDSSDRVITALSAAAKIVAGPAVRQGSSPWSWFDDTYLQVSTAACAAIPALPGTTLQAGTVSVTVGSNVITGTGTSFNTLFSAGDVIVIYYATGHQRAKAITLTGITATSMQMGNNWDAGTGTLSGLSYGKTTSTLSNAWTSSQTSWNYYDAVHGLYQQYWRTGKTEFLTCARDLADKYWTYTLDSGDICDTGTDCVPNRAQSLVGMMLRANDGVSSMWPGIVKLVDEDYAGWLAGQQMDGLDVMIDPRESGYAYWFLTSAAALHPDSSQRATYLALAESTFTNVWQRKQTATGAWMIDAADPNTGLPSLGYTGVGTFPWHAFAALSGMQRLYELNADTDILSVISLGLSYLGDRGWNPDNNCFATRYATEFTLFEGGSPGQNCPYSGGTIKCAQDASCSIGVDMNRALNSEHINMWGWVYSKTSTASYQTRGDLLFGKTFGYDGTGTNVDGGAGTFKDFVLVPGGYYLKEYGQVAGAGRSEEYLAYRNGAIPAPASESLSVGFTLTGVTSAAKIRITITMPNGATSSTTCTTSPCVVTGLDTNQGTAALMLIEYLTSGDVVTAVGDNQPVTIN